MREVSAVNNELKTHESGGDSVGVKGQALSSGRRRRRPRRWRITVYLVWPAAAVLTLTAIIAALAYFYP